MDGIFECTPVLFELAGFVGNHHVGLFSADMESFDAFSIGRGKTTIEGDHDDLA